MRRALCQASLCASLESPEAYSSRNAPTTNLLYSALLVPFLKVIALKSCPKVTLILILLSCTSRLPGCSYFSQDYVPGLQERCASARMDKRAVLTP